MANSEHFFLLADGWGNFLSKKRLMCLSSEKVFIALDGACCFLRDLEIIPNIVLGDMDSASPDVRRYFEEKGSKIVITPDQDFSDLEKGIMYCFEHGAKSITIFNACFGRMDHFIGNVFFLKKYHNPHCAIEMFTESSRILFLRDEVIDLQVPIGAKCGFFGFPNCVVSASGVKYKLNQKPLELGVCESLANEFTEKNIRCDIRGDCLMMYEF